MTNLLSPEAETEAGGRSKAFLVLCLLTGSAVILAVWLFATESLLKIYLSIGVIFGVARVLDLPAASWWGVRRVRAAKVKWGSRRLKHTYGPTDAVRKLSDVPAAKTYFMSSVYEENTQKLCNSYQEGHVMRVAGALLAALVFYWRSKAHVSTQSDEITKLFNYVGALAPALLALTWDYSRFERQRTLNRDVPSP
jgi:hypothetical protein